jgi:hypothetical protein
MEQLIDAVLAHAKFLRKSARAGDDYIARAVEREAERWEALAATARAELAPRTSPVSDLVESETNLEGH